MTPRLPRYAQEMRRLLRSARGAFDLPSILAGVVVVGILTAGVLAAVFSVIPFAQDNGAKQDLSAINTAQGVHKAMKGRFVDDVSLESAELVGELPAELTITATDDGGKYCASTRSKTGRYFTVTSENTTPREGTCGGPDAAPDEFSAEPVAMTRRMPAVSGNFPNPWVGLDSSADGKYMVGAISNNYLYTSSDAGVNWTAHTELPQATADTTWADMAVSDDGSRMYASTLFNDFYRSLDFGVTWQRLTMPVPETYGFSSVATSANGMTILAGNRSGTAHAPDGGYMYLSKNGGDTWSRVNYATWNGRDSVSVSADGMTLTGSYGSEVLVSTNGGATWTARTVALYRAQGMESTGDGGKIIAANQGGEAHTKPLPNGQLFTSADKGVSWTKSGPSGFWKGMSMSADGSKIVLANYAGYVTVSVDSGATWTELKSLGSDQWITVTVSADGSTFAAGTGSGSIYAGKLKG